MVTVIVCKYCVIELRLCLNKINLKLSANIYESLVDYEENKEANMNWLIIVFRS